MLWRADECCGPMLEMWHPSPNRCKPNMCRLRWGDDLLTSHDPLHPGSWETPHRILGTPLQQRRGMDTISCAAQTALVLRLETKAPQPQFRSSMMHFTSIPAPGRCGSAHPDVRSPGLLVQGAGKGLRTDLPQHPTAEGCRNIPLQPSSSQTLKHPS